MRSPTIPFTYCRDSRCRKRLPDLVEISRLAFCDPACSNRFYLQHCATCERQLDRRIKQGRPPLFCSARCKSRFHRNPAAYAFFEVGRVVIPAALPNHVTGANFRAPLPLHVIMTGRDG